MREYTGCLWLRNSPDFGQSNIFVWEGDKGYDIVHQNQKLSTTIQDLRYTVHKYPCSVFSYKRKVPLVADSSGSIRP